VASVEVPRFCVSPRSPPCPFLPLRSLRFSTRLYGRFNVDLKVLNLRYPLPAMMEMPGVYVNVPLLLLLRRYFYQLTNAPLRYDARIVPPSCFRGLEKLDGLSRANRLEEARVQSLFPPVGSLLDIELRYGESVSTDDIFGVDAPDHAQDAVERLFHRTDADASADLDTAEVKRLCRTSGLRLSEAQIDELIMSADEDGSGTMSLLEFRSLLKSFTRRKAPTDAANEEWYETIMADGRSVPDFLETQREFTRTATAAAETATAERRAALAADPVSAAHTFSGQRLQYTELKKEELRRTLSKRAGDKAGAYTYSAQFQSLAVPLVNEESIARDAAVESRARWKTLRGFVYVTAAAAAAAAAATATPCYCHRRCYAVATLLLRCCYYYYYYYYYYCCCCCCCCCFFHCRSSYH